ncbi:damage-inducible protein DinB [Rhizobium cremeum]|uniref:DinB family protein n=1 Tax=Rhizobium cremeum TaxID=2813827 RepID=UPI000DDD9CD7|nr:DinB family protein [Rhizobium cremeum]MCJ7994113.1 damage-inducible protein DinB [Rhizobium cremeum]MCJ7999170.1 damage-inducible protein DinB [Rhizobium cremeum]
MTEEIDPCRVFRKLARNNALANLRLHDAVARLRPGEFEAERTSFFPSIRATLNHILVIDWFYVDALEGGTLGPRAWENDMPFPDPETLHAAQAAVDRRLLAFCDGLKSEDLSRVVDIHRGSRIQHDRCDDVLSHLFQHQTHHRGQVHAMLAGTGIRPPQLDEFIVGDDASAREREMAAIGWSEAELMR